MVEKSDDEKHFSWWCCFRLQLPLLFFLVTLVSSVAFLCFLSSCGFSSLLVTSTILVVSTFVFFLIFFKKKKNLCLAERSQEEDDDDDDEDEDGLIEIALVGEEAETIEVMRSINQSRRRFRIGHEDQEEEIDDVNMEEDNLIEIDISIGSIKRRM
ncbi:hypothetical protein V5N11_009669 [Cardamine amara subsp. amara]|uniref:Transmembrane protein n=1 Tax=Cardamine amara subsp. amara TaxID=228776 RepID=A0ABD1A0U0_CARAN